MTLEPTQPIRIALLGSTGSIGTQTLDIVRAHPDRFQIVAIAAGSNTALLELQIREFRPRMVSLDCPASVRLPLESEVRRGQEGLIACATHPDVDVVFVATSGLAALEAIIEAARMGRVIALANKEALVCAADLILPVVKNNAAELRPVDSEHSAIWQVMGALTRSDVKRLTLTASGGPFRGYPAEKLARVTSIDALKHPTWKMGAKITIDSATLVNKGLEVIEAHRLFEIPLTKIDAIVHPESIVHSLVEFEDGSSIAQLSEPDMRLPIQYALTAPQHAFREAIPLDLAALGSLTFEAPDHRNFPALNLCRKAGERGGSACTALCAADEVAVDSFVSGAIGFRDIATVLHETLEQHVSTTLRSIADVQAVHDESTAIANEIIAAL